MLHNRFSSKIIKMFPGTIKDSLGRNSQMIFHSVYKRLTLPTKN